MQLEDKLVDGREAAHEESQQREDVESRGEEVLPAPIVEAMRDAALERRSQLLGAVRMILARQTFTVAELHLPAREALALEALQVATSGRSADLDQFVYASDRRDMLERALAVLQPDLIHADSLTARELGAQFADLTERVAELRSQLTDLEDAQDELLEGDQKAALAAAQAEPGDKPKPKPPAPLDPDAPRPPTTLVDPELPAEPAPPTTLIGPERAAPPTPPTTLVGPDLPAEPAPPTTLVGPELPAEPARPTTLVGPERAPAPAPPSSLGDAKDLEAGARPWWRRPFG